MALPTSALENVIFLESTTRRLAHPALVALCGALVVGFLLGPIFARPHRYGRGDWQQYHSHDQIAITSLEHFGQIPLWSPYTRGGKPYLASSSPNNLSPFFPLKLIWGTALGTKLALAVQLWIGFILMFLLARDLGLGRLWALLPASLFASCTFLVVQIAGGHAWAVPFVYYPGIILGYRLAAANLAWVPFPALLISLTVLEGGIYPFPFLLVLFAFYSLSACFGGFPDRGPVRARPHLRPLLVMAAIFLPGLLLVCPRLIPQIAYLQGNPRIVDCYDQIPLSLAWESFTSRRVAHEWPLLTSQNYGWWGEYTHFMGELGLALAAATAVLRFRRYAALCLYCLLFFLFMLGNHGPWSPYELLSSLPVYENLRVPTRFGFLVWFHLIFIITFGLRDLSDFARGLGSPRLRVGLGTVLVSLLALGVVTDVAVQNRRWMKKRFWKADKPDAGVTFGSFRQVRSGRYGTYLRTRLNLGSYGAYEPNPTPRSRKIRLGDVPQFWLAERAVGRVEQQYWSPNRLEFEVDLDRSTQLVINQNHYPGWRASRGGVVSRAGLLAVDLPTGAGRVVVDFWPPGLTAGLLMGLLGLLACLAAPVFGYRVALSSGRGEATELTPLAKRAIDLGGPAALVLTVAVASLLFQPSFDQLMARAHDHVARNWKRGDRLVIYPPCAGPSCARFDEFSKHSWKKRPLLDGRRKHRLWLVYTRPVQKRKVVKRMTEGYRVADRKRFSYLEVSLIEPGP